MFGPRFSTAGVPAGILRPRSTLHAEIYRGATSSQPHSFCGVSPRIAAAFAGSRGRRMLAGTPALSLPVYAPRRPPT